MFATLIPLESSIDVAIQLNAAPRYRLDGKYSCWDCLEKNKRFGLFVLFNEVYEKYTPDFMEWNIASLYYPVSNKVRF